jgi:hypothetical protein
MTKVVRDTPSSDDAYMRIRFHEIVFSGSQVTGPDKQWFDL